MSAYYIDDERRVRVCATGLLTDQEAFRLIEECAEQAMTEIDAVLDDDVQLLFAHESIRRILELATAHANNPPPGT